MTRLKPGTVVVLEGLDGTGKSTQLELLRALLGDEHFTHQPSGDTAVGKAVYKITEKNRSNLTPVARQFLHLAAHAEQYAKHIIPALKDRGVIMDRCWWSTFAYGYYGGLEFLMDMPDFIKMIRLPTQDVMPSVVFVFMHVHKSDANNTVNVIKGYEMLALDLYPEVMEPIGEGLNEIETTQQIMDALDRRGLLIEQEY